MIRSRPDSRSKTIDPVARRELDVRRRAGLGERALEVGGEHADPPIGRQLASDQDVMLIGAGLAAHRDCATTSAIRMPGVNWYSPGRCTWPFNDDRVLENRADRWHAHQVATLQRCPLPAAVARFRSTVVARPLFVDTLEASPASDRPSAAVRRRGCSSCAGRRFILELVDRRPPHLAGQTDRRPDRRNEDDVAGLQPLVRAGIALEQQVV